MTKLNITSENGKLNLLDLPHNCVFNKKITGCGGTTIALFNNENYVIAVPTKELIVNKTNSSEPGLSVIENYDGTRVEVLGLFDTFNYGLKKLVKEYVNKEGAKKIICTYDKINALAKLINTSDFRLLVDEYQVLLKAYIYRSKAINGVIEHFKNYKSYCFMSATPITADFKPEFLKESEEVEAVWNATDKLKVNLIETNKPYVTAANIINSFLGEGMSIDGVKVEELFFFLNSVNSIASIIKYCNLSPDMVKIVCSDKESNRKKLEGYDIVNSRSENKPITFITSCSFEGCDYNSEKGVSFIVSNSGDAQTQLDIATDIYQIAGRIRTESNPFRTKLFHIYNTTGNTKLNLDITYDEMVSLIKDEEEGANAILKTINENEKAAKMATKMLNEAYIIKEGEKYVLNDMLIKLELFNYNINQQIYKNGISLASNYYKNNVEVCGNDEAIKETETLKRMSKKMSFKEAFLKYAEIKNNPYSMESVQMLVSLQPLIVKAYNILGVDKVKRLNYVKTKIEAAIISGDSTKSFENKVAKLLKSRISNYSFCPSSELKSKFSEIYSELNYTEKKAAATHIEKYYDCKPVSKRIDGVKVKGYDIIRPKFIFSE